MNRYDRLNIELQISVDHPIRDQRDGVAGVILIQQIILATVA